MKVPVPKFGLVDEDVLGLSERKRVFVVYEGWTAMSC